MKKLMLTGAFFTVLCTIAQTDSIPAFVKDSLDNYVNRAMKEWSIPGAAVCIVKDDKIITMKGYGVKELGVSDIVDEHTLFTIGSISKTFTATALAMLEEEKLPAGKPVFSLNDRVQKWLPYFTLYAKPAGEHAIVRDLLSHRIGFNGQQGSISIWNRDLSRRQVIEKMALMKPSYPFRTTWGYSNTAYVAAGEIIPAVTGLSLDAYLREKIFQPLSMDRTVASDAALLASTNKAKGHALINDRLSTIPYGRLEHLMAAGGISSSISDMSHWVLAELHNGQYNGRQIISTATIQKTWYPHTIMGPGHNLYNKGHFLSYALGWFTQEYNGYQMLAHTGRIDGFSTVILLVPDKKLGIVVLTNTSNNNFPRALFWEIVDAWFGLPYRNYSQVYLEAATNENKAYITAIQKLHDTVASRPATALPMEDYTGHYTDSVYGNVQIIRKDGQLQLMMEHHPQRAVILKPLGGHRFLASFSPVNFGELLVVFNQKNNGTLALHFENIFPGPIEELEFIKQQRNSNNR